ncbi:MAG: Gfo/Idh/MocA family oxidoreductase [Pirellulaceae bacterium]|jgi:predicted dehydrogenase|nr:Gfo/Idh/MocA family oxidoreductase [Pirellulaceae bacterium]
MIHLPSDALGRLDVTEISRRSYLSKSSAILAAGAFSQIAVAETDGKQLINVGLITEPTASHRSGYLNVLASCDGVRSVSVVDKTETTFEDSRRRLGDRFGRGFKDARQMLAAVRPELTVVTTEGHNAPTAVTAALEAGSHVLTEKPSCTKLEQFEQIARLAGQRNRHLMLAMATRSSAAIKKARQLITNGVIGTPYSVNLVWVADQTRLTEPAYHQSWLADRQRAGGGKLIYHGIHYLDVIQHLLGEPIRKINGFTQNVGGQPIEVEDSAVVSFRFASGATGTLNTGYYLDGGKQSEIRIWGSHGWLRMEHIERRPLQWYSTRPDAMRGIQQYEYAHEPGLYDLFFQDAIDSIRNGSPPPITTRESLSALRTVFSAYKAVETGRTQSVDPVQQE